MAFQEVKTEYWIPEKVGEQITGYCLAGGEVETEYGTADYVAIKDKKTGDEVYVIVSGGLKKLPEQMGKMVRITFEGEKENPKAKKGRNKFFKSFKLEVDASDIYGMEK